jgi:hypothetical protein
LMDLKKISTTSVLETGKISPLTVPDEALSWAGQDPPWVVAPMMTMTNVILVIFFI